MNKKPIIRLVLALWIGGLSWGYANKTWGHYTSLAKEKVEDFNALSVQGNLEVDFMQGPAVKIYGSGPQKVIEAAFAQVKDGVLHLGFLPGRETPANLRVVVTGPRLEKVTLAGHAQVHVRGPLKTQTLHLELRDQSDFAADGLKTDLLHLSVQDNAEADINRLDAQHVVASAQGKADIELAGLALKATLENKGGGEIDASDLRVQTGTAAVYGKGNVEISAYENLSASAFGKGKIKYKGSPASTQRNGNLKLIVADLED